MSSTPLSYQELLTLSRELSTTENIHERERLIAQLISTIEQRIPLVNAMGQFFLENFKAQELAVTLLEQNAAHVPIDEIIRTNFLDDFKANKVIQKVITIRRAEIPVKPFLDGLLYDDRLIRIKAIKGLKALREYAPVEVLLATIHDADHIIASRAAEAIVLRQEPLLLAKLLEDFMVFHWCIQCAILDTANQLNILIPLELLNYALHRPEINMRKAAVKGLGKHGKDAPIDALENALQDGYTTSEALQTLGEIATYKNYHLFTEIIYDPQKMTKVRIEAAQIMARKEQHVPVQPLLALLYRNDVMQDHKQQIQALLKEIGEAIVEDALSYAHTSATVTAQIAALQIMSVLGEPSLASNLRAISRNRRLDEHLRRAAMDTIGEQKELSSSDTLRSILQNDADDHIKMHAHTTLIKLGQIDEDEIYMPSGSYDSDTSDLLQQRWERIQNNTASLVYLITTMQSDQQTPQEIARVVADKLLEDYSPGQMAEFLLEQEKDETTKNLSISHAISALHPWSDEQAITVIQALLYHEDYKIHSQCFLMLLPDHPEVLFTYLNTIIDEMDETKHGGKIAGLTRFRESIQKQVTSKQEKQERDTNRYEAIIDILAQIEETSFSEEIFNESEVTVRRAVTSSLKGIQGDGPIETVLAGLHDEDIYVRMNALGSVEELGARVPLAPIIAALDDPDYEVRATAMLTLSGQKRRVPREVFLKGLFIDCDGSLPDMGERDFEQPAPVIAAQVLAELREVRAIEPLLTLLDHREDEIRAAAVEALGHFGEDVPLAPLLAALEDTDGNVRASACLALEMQAATGRAIPIEPLLAALGDSDSDSNIIYDEPCSYYNCDYGRVRKAAAHALLIIQPQALLALASDLNDTLDGSAVSPLFDALTKSQIADTIRDIKYASPIFIEKLTQFLAHPYWEVRMKAMRAIEALEGTSSNLTT